jgi:putative transposase
VNRSRRPRLRLTPVDRVLWAWLSRSWCGWRSAIHIVKPETVIAWHRGGFRLFWTWKSRHRTGRPTVPYDVRALIHEMSTANALWGAPRIHGELQKLRITVSESTVAKYLQRHPRPPSQTWRTFLTNHASQIVAADFFVVQRSHSGCSSCSSSSRRTGDGSRRGHRASNSGLDGATAAQCFPENDAPRYLLHDRDSVFAEVATTIAAMNTQAVSVRTAPHSPWQNAYAERVIGSIRRACLDHVIVMNAGGLHRVLTEYVAYYLRSRTHLSLGKDTPSRRPVIPPSAGHIVTMPEVGGLHHRYDRIAA